MNLLSIQSHVAYGHVGNAAAVFPLQRIGVEVWPIHTVQFSNHPGYGDWTGHFTEPVRIRELIAGIEKRGLLGNCDGVLSGYIGVAETGAAILDAVASVKAANPAARYCCDPVIGDAGRGVYVDESVAQFIKAKAVPAADIVTPNQFELGFLTGGEIKTRGDVLAAIGTLQSLGPRTVLVTSLQTDETPDDCIEMVACDPQGRYVLRTRRLAPHFNGAGDAIAALFFAWFLREGSAGKALSLAASAIFGILSKTVEAGSRELALVAAQDEIVKPTRYFEAAPIE